MPVSRRHALGQHFLIDNNIARYEVDLAAVKPGSKVLEIGPGRGILTELLLKKGGSVLAVEIDRSLSQHLEPLKERYPEFEVVYQDILEWIPLHRELSFDRVVSNMPYNISTPLLFAILELQFSRAVLMIQDEFARRVCYREDMAKKDYSRLTVAVYSKCESEYICKVGKDSFEPPPEVDSAIVVLKKRKEPPFEIYDEKLFTHVVKAAFVQRRKMLKNSLKPLLSSLNSEAFGELEFFFSKRPEELKPEEFAHIANIIHENRKCLKN